MGVEFFRGNNTRCPPFLVFGLMIMCVYLLCNWWSLSSQNFELLKQIDNVVEQLRVNGEELGKCTQQSMLLEEKLKDSKIKFDQQQIKIEQAKESEDEIKENYQKIESELNDVRKKSDSVETDLKLCHTEMESWKKVSESQNKTLETLLSEKNSLKLDIVQKDEKIKELQDKINNGNNNDVSSIVKSKFRQPIVKVMEAAVKDIQQKEGDLKTEPKGVHYSDPAQIEKDVDDPKNYGDPSIPSFDSDPRELAMKES